MGRSTTTIFARATPPGRSAISVVRVSGPRAHEAPAIFSAKCPPPGRFHVARLNDRDGAPIDQALILSMAGPASSTGEDVVEFHLHGSMAVTRAVMERLAGQEGFRAAEPGEFTHRGFDNAKIDLLGTEALADLIDAETDLQRIQAWRQLDGALHEPVERWRQAVVRTAARLEALIDFSDEELPDGLDEELRLETGRLVRELTKTLDDGRFGEHVREGVVVGILGPVNAGKSTLMNMLAGRDVAIVSSRAGTTRDVLQLRMDLDGVPVTLLDTAGIRQAGDEIEAEGIRRARDAARNAHATLIVLDGSAPDWRESLEEMRKLAGTRQMVVLNKMDLAGGDMAVAHDEAHQALKIALDPADGNPGAPSPPGREDNRKEVNKVVEALRELVMGGNEAGGDVVITRERHRFALSEARNALKAALTHDMAKAPELAAEEYRRAADNLGRITGRIDVEQLLDSIFSSFCIGK